MHHLMIAPSTLRVDALVPGDFFGDGGLLMSPILFCAVVVVGLAIEHYLSMRRTRVFPRVVVDAARQVIEGHSDVIMAGILEARAPAARVLAAGLRRRGCLLADVEKAMDDRLHEERRLLSGNARGVWMMATIAPLLGLLGTIFGIMDAFASVENAGLATVAENESFAAGMRTALHTLAFGLCVAIFATVLATHIQARVSRLIAEIADVIPPVCLELAALLPPSGESTTPVTEAPHERLIGGGGPDETHAA